jgi:sugar lactone lactonase YvrE
VAGPDDALASASGVAFSIDGQTIYVASSGARGVIAFRLADASRSTFACNCVPAALVSMGSAFRITEPENGPVWLLDTAAPEPRLVFVPAAQK